jgi:hypothetical protein
MWIINEVQLLRSDTVIKASLIIESVTEIQIVYNLARENLTTRRTHYLSDLTYNYLSLSPSKVEITPLHLGSTVIARPGRRPRLPHSPSNIHQRVAVTVWPSSYRSYKVYRTQKILHALVLVNACSTWTNTMRSLIGQGEGYHRGAPNLISDHSQPSHWVFSTCRPLVPSPSLRLKLSLML